jgi:hypothetical protein
MAAPSAYRILGRRGIRLPLGAYLPGHPVHVVIAVEGRRPVAACLMPDHLHWLLADAARMVRVVQRFKSITSGSARQRGDMGKLWQRSYWDHVVRREESLVQVARYIAANPVRAGLVAEVGDYPFQIVRLDGHAVTASSLEASRL